MSYALYSTDERRLQRKLIPVNILIAILSLVAAISLVFTPLLTVNMGTFIKGLSVVLEEEGGEGANGAVIVEAEGDGEIGDDSGNTADGSKILTMLGDILDAEIVINPLDMAKVMFAPAEEKGKMLTDKFLIDNGMFETMTISMVNIAIVAASESDDSILENVDLGKLNDELKKFDGVQNKTEFDSKIDGFIVALQEQLTDVTLTQDDKDIIKDELNKMYDDTVAKTEGEFTSEKMICVTLSPEDGEVYTSYGDLVAGMADTDPEQAEGMTSLLVMVTSMMETAAPIYGYGFIYVLANALIWIILFLFSFFHMFARNKRFTMWYAKLAGCWPCIIFWGILSFGGAKLAPQFAVAAKFAELLTAFSSLTWISGICYLLMWAISICWAFPIKHKIRKMRKGRL